MKPRPGDRGAFEYDIAYVPLGAGAYGGAERSLLDIAAGAAGMGYRPVILAGRILEGTAFPAAARRLGLELSWGDWDPLQPLAHNIGASFRAFRSTRARLIHFNMSWRRGMWVVPIVARLATSSFLVASMRAMPDPHQLVPRRRYLGFIPGLGLWHIPEALAGRWWARLSDVTICINEKDYPTRLVAHYGYDRRKIQVIPNGIRFRERPLEEAERLRQREALGVPADDWLTCFVGRISREKGIHHLIDALATLPDRHRLVVVGTGPDEENLRAQVERLGLTARVQFLGYVDHPDDLMACSDAVAVPSVWYEAFGRTVVEAMNQGVPVIASRLGGMAEVFTDGVEGVYVEPRKPEAIARALGDLAARPAAARAMGEAGRERVRTHYSVERVIAQHRVLYESFLGPPGLGKPAT